LIDTGSFFVGSTITVMTSLVALSFYGASQLKFHWVERYDKLLVGSVLCLVGILTLIFHDHDHQGHGDFSGEHLNRKLIGLWAILFWYQALGVFIILQHMYLYYIRVLAIRCLSCYVSQSQWNSNCTVMKLFCHETHFHFGNINSSFSKLFYLNV